jgi:hypothetical protein
MFFVSLFSFRLFPIQNVLSRVIVWVDKREKLLLSTHLHSSRLSEFRDFGRFNSTCTTNGAGRLTFKWVNFSKVIGAAAVAASRRGA